MIKGYGTYTTTWTQNATELALNYFTPTLNIGSQFDLNGVLSFFTILSKVIKILITRAPDKASI